ncbi:trypsin-like serine protease [Streptomyces sp. NPDC020379]|uniref:trypsin-like serine protease n=1 Tax=Streptomyces sp. NPDC020379 TaxID=3365071 RepID=UPI00379449A8
MRKIQTAAVAAGAAAALCAVNNAGAFAISGGTPAPAPSAAVHLHVSYPPDNFDCTGALIGPHWVLSASGCNFGDLSKYPTTIDRGDGTAYNVDAAYNSPSSNSDVALFHISQAVPAPTGPPSDPAASGYMVLTDKTDALPAMGDTELVYGWDPSSLNKLNVKVTRFGTEPGGPFPYISGSDCKSGGCLGPADYGSPILHNVNGTTKVVATSIDFSTVDDRVHCDSEASNIVPQRDWIKSTTGI